MNQAIKDSCSGPGDEERERLSRYLQYPLYQNVRMIVLRRIKGNILKSPVRTPQQIRALKRMIIISMWGFFIMVPQKTCYCGTPRFRISFSRNPVMMQSPSLTLLNFYCPDKPRGIFYSFKLRFVTKRSLLRVHPLLPSVGLQRTPSLYASTHSEHMMASHATQNCWFYCTSILKTPT